ncbi:DNA polymerase III subunit delta [Candidatus Saccharibacteria bacterium]|nr:DNA polymerase III subunit delta [Candidatus Saccharibacteria bacterium]
MTVFIAGNNSFALRRRLDELVSKFVKEYGDLALEKFDGEEADAKEIIEGLQSLPFLAKRKMVVIGNGSLNKDFVEAAEQIISSIGESTDVIFYEPQIDKRTAYFKLLKNNTQLEEFNEMDTRSLAQWLVDETKKSGGTLSFADANYLVERLGTNQALLANELGKLLIYNSRITRENIELLTEPNPQSRVFDLLDAAFAGQKGRAIKLYDEQRAQKVEPQAILAMIAWQLNIIAIAKYSKGQDISEVSRQSGVKDYPLRKARRLADKLSDKDLKKMVSEALVIDWRGKTTSLDMDEALKTYIISL